MKTNFNHVATRREFLVSSGIGGGAIACGTRWTSASDPAAANAATLSIDRQILWNNMDGSQVTWFHPRACMVPNRKGRPLALMTLQSITGSDYFGPVHASESNDMGHEWSSPVPIPAFGRQAEPGHPGLQRGVCDVVPQHHPASNTVLAMGHVVFYRGNRFSRGDQLSRYPVYAVRNVDGIWSDPHRLAWDDPRGAFIYTNNCGQRVVLPDGDILLAFTFGAQAEHRAVAGVRCSFDGQQLAIKQVGPALQHPHKRGLLEPSMVQFEDRFLLTMRAEDNRGYVSVSDDGLHWRRKQEWRWDRGEPLTMSTTQQHWLVLNDRLYLVYTRRDATNVGVVRWRSPLFIAQVNTRKMTLLRDTEQIVIPLQGDGVKRPYEVPLMGNFNITQVSSTESWVTVGSWVPKMQARGTTFLARLKSV